MQIRRAKIKIRRADERGRTKTSWLDSRHSFSFGEYYDPNYTGFGVLRVINDDRVAPGGGFATHGHKDMEIISYVLDGQLAHKDSTGKAAIIRSGDVQRMTAGSGVRHSEYNPSESQPVHFLQIWVVPDAGDLAPGYAQTTVNLDHQSDHFKLVAGRNPNNDAIHINQDLNMYVAKISDKDQTLKFEVPMNRKAWVHLARGQVVLNDVELNAGDGVAIESSSLLNFSKGLDAEIIIFEMA